MDKLIEKIHQLLKKEDQELKELVEELNQLIQGRKPEELVSVLNELLEDEGYCLRMDGTIIRTDSYRPPTSLSRYSSAYLWNSGESSFWLMAHAAQARSFGR